MRFFLIIATLLLIRFNKCGPPLCAATSYCQSCLDDATTCSTCYNWGKGTVALDKTWAASSGSSVCSGTLLAAYKVTDCLENEYVSQALSYSGITAVAVTTHPRCVLCDNKKFITFNGTSADELCTNTAPTMSNPSCLEIEHCAMTVCVNDAAPSTWCVFCIDHRKPVQSTTQLGASGEWGYRIASCSTELTVTITNCINYVIDPSSSSDTIAYNCYDCVGGFAVAVSNKSCVTYSIDAACRKIGLSGYCNVCYASYYFDGTGLCKLRSFMVLFSSMMIVFIGGFF